MHRPARAAPRRIHVVGHRGQRDERHRRGPGRHGPPGLGQRPAGLARPRPVGRARGAGLRRPRRGQPRPRPRSRSRPARRRRHLHRRPRRQPRGRRRPGAVGAGAGPRRWCWPPSAASGGRSPSAAPTARPPRRRCSPWDWSAPACARRSSSAARSSAWGRAPAGTTATGWWWRRTRATAPSSTLPCDTALVTSVEPDHLEHYGSFAVLEDAFDQFLGHATGHRLVCADDPGAAALGRAPRRGVLRDGGRRPTCAWSRSVGGRSSVRFGLLDHGRPLGEVEVPLPGLHNARNAAGAVAAALAGGGTVRLRWRRRWPARRASAAGSRSGASAGGVTFVDDYAHLPGEVAAALAAARDGGWRRIVCVFQPHRYSRTAALWRDFAGAFDRRRPPRWSPTCTPPASRPGPACPGS